MQLLSLSPLSSLSSLTSQRKQTMQLLRVSTSETQETTKLLAQTNDMLNIFIAEDEPLAAAKLKLFLQKLGETDVRVFDNGVSLLARLTEEIPDVLLLDIHMPGATGMQVMERIGLTKQNTMQIIVTSAYEQYALESFNYNVTDYLLKPYTLERLRVALEKAKTNIRLLNLDKQTSAEVITVRCDGKSVIIPVQDIVLLESLKDYVRIVTSDRQKRITMGTLGSFADKLPEDFVRIHRSYLININHLSEYNSQTVTMLDGSQISIGRTYREQFESILPKK